MEIDSKNKNQNRRRQILSLLGMRPKVLQICDGGGTATQMPEAEVSGKGKSEVQSDQHIGGTMENIERSVVIGDLHIPFHDKIAVELVLKFIKFFKPHNIFLNGDVIDCWEISKFAKPLSIKSRMLSEIEQTKKFLKALRQVAPDAKIIYTFGNHEFRFEKFIALNAKELYGLEGLTLEDQLHLKEYGIIPINCHLRENYYRYGHILIGHFNRTNKHSGYTAKNLLEDKGMSLIQAHTHRGGISYKRDYQKTMIAVEGFCLCSLQPKYMLIPNWQLGFCIIHKDTKSDFFKITPMEIIKHKILFGNKIF